MIDRHLSREYASLKLPAVHIAARESVLATVRSNPQRFSPADLIEYLVDAGHDENAVRIALWYLLDMQKIYLTEDWRLTNVLP